MSESQWFNRPTWTADDRRDFLRHLERVRSAIARAQYVLIQARCLFDAGLYEPALRLLSLILERYPTPPELLKARILRARCYAASGDADRAVEEFRCAVALERTSSEKSGAWIVFGLFVVEHHRSTLFSEISRIFEEFSSQLPKLETPRQRYEARLVLAALAAHHCQADQARAHARAALAAASETSSRVRNHRAPRLVGEMKSALHAALEGWAKD